MSNTNTDKKSKKSASHNGQNGASVAPVVQEAVASPVPTVSIEGLPADIQAVLKGFKSQLSAAPSEIQNLIASYLFDRAPSPVQPPAPVNPEPETQGVSSGVAETSLPAPVEGSETVAPAPTLNGSSAQSPVVQKFQKQDVPAGFQRLPPLLMYSAEANGYAPLRALAVDVLQWGSRPVIVVLCKDPVFVLNASGDVVQAPPKTPFAIPAESDLGNFVRPLAEDPAGAYEIFFSPASIVRDDTGLQILRYDPIGIGARVPKATVLG